MADRITHLPDEIIGHIATFLSAQDAFYVSITSKRFQNLFSFILNLEFDEESAENLPGFLDRILALPETKARIRKFSLKCHSGFDPDHFNRCLRHVVKLGVMDIKLCINGENERSLPLELFNCKTVVKLQLGSAFVITGIPNNALLPSLETLVLESVKFDSPADCAFKALLSACPVLKELEIDGMYWESWNWSGNVSSPTLQRLTIGRDLSLCFDMPDFQSISFNTPSLTYLYIADFVPDAYPMVNFDSLVEAKLVLQVLVNRQWHSMYPREGDALSSNPTNLIQGMRNVKILELSSPLSFETFSFFREAIPVFGNLHKLKIIDDDTGSCWRFLPVLLNKTPNLKTFIIEGGLHYVEEDDYVEEDEYVCRCLSGYSCLLSCPVEVLDIQLWDGGTPGELEQVKHFLGKLSCLKLLKVRLWERISNSEKLRIAKELRVLPRASTECKIQIVGPSMIYFYL